ncbi:MAG: hypothetical protein M4579_002062 [Chaenotheca gracillima]|nr:MAG: hypothetical protein M4579_002062 [Chaenotheca gracillima]
MSAPVTQRAFEFLPLGAIIQRFTVGGHNIVLNFNTQDAYDQHNTSHFGATIGRVANRVKGATIDRLNGKSYQLAANNGPNSLHGGVKGWGKQLWAGPTKEIKDGNEAFRFTYRSSNGDQGFPGAVDVSVVYVETREPVSDGGEKTVLTFDYEAKLADDQEDDVQETAVNMTNHSYFNLSDQPSIEGTEATLSTNQYLPLDDGGIPTAGPTTHASIPDNKPFTLGPKDPDLDDCFITNSNPSSVPLDTRTSPLTLAASFYHPKTRLNLEVLSTEPAFQFYTGKYIDVPAVGGAPQRVPRSGFCVEPSRYVNAINVDEWRSQVLLKKGQVYGSRIVYKAWKS